MKKDFLPVHFQIQPLNAFSAKSFKDTNATDTQSGNRPCSDRKRTVIVQPSLNKRYEGGQNFKKEKADAHRWSHAQTDGSKKIGRGPKKKERLSRNASVKPKRAIRNSGCNGPPTCLPFLGRLWIRGERPSSPSVSECHVAIPSQPSMTSRANLLACCNLAMKQTLSEQATVTH